MSKKYFTLTGTQFCFGKEFLKSGMNVYLEKEEDNKYDKEAIQVKMKANSPRTVLGESYSAGRLYDKIGKKAKGKVIYVLDQGVLCQLKD